MNSSFSYQTGVHKCGKCGNEKVIREIKGDNMIALIMQDEEFTCECGAKHTVHANSLFLDDDWREQRRKKRAIKHKINKAEQRKRAYN